MRWLCYLKHFQNIWETENCCSIICELCSKWTKSNIFNWHSFKYKTMWAILNSPVNIFSGLTNRNQHGKLQRARHIRRQFINVRPGKLSEKNCIQLWIYWQRKCRHVKKKIQSFDMRNGQRQFCFFLCSISYVMVKHFIVISCSVHQIFVIKFYTLLYMGCSTRMK